ncbi:transglutaminase TgpA family protein [Aureliella helgolandensis]|uniref:Protein-glutamine gamma-glutamyltransferase n=1 Tax=Aureliella helgolandensis TaxID=2527968 RepID=A0A518GC71_9BACT|nr:DUF3488 and transglutaminase-like domain-containing protein [Aureliella helgolandensis]QDV26173.1 Protein-glutamine gamma-glutamyltransferase [Aureliella helgolandensis]
MDISKVKLLRRSLSLHFAIIAWLTAMLVATGTGSFFLPILIFFVSLSAYIFVDTLEWFEVGRIGSYLLMTIATTIALGGYIYSAFYASSEAGQLLAVASLLVYPEAVLFLQKKNLRIFEQLAVFLLLEMVVAALVNDNILFGMLLAPIMILWVSSLFLFARYATLLNIDPNIDQPIPHLAELIYQQFRRKKSAAATAQPMVECGIITSQNAQGSRVSRRLLQSIPIGFGAIAFAAVFFYLLPRTSPAGLSQPLGLTASSGLPRKLTIGGMAKLKMDSSPVMRVSFTYAGKKTVYPMNEAPYLRARVMDSYLSVSSYSRSQNGEWVYAGMTSFRKMPTIEAVNSLRAARRDLVELEIDLRRRYLPTLFTVTSSYNSRPDQQVKLRYDYINSLLEELEPMAVPSGKFVVYKFGAASFQFGRQVPISPVTIGDSIRERMSFERNRVRLELGFRGMQELDAYRQDLLSKQGVPPESVFQIAQTIENDLMNSGKFTYSLDLKPPADPGVDPIEDFVINQRSGHCQYFASAMLAMLRQSGIPARMVVGYHPREYNYQGDYFAVRQSDAHAWVEALFRRDQLVGTSVERWLTDDAYFWVRFDPTPGLAGGDDEIIGQDGQTLDYAEKLWKDYVVDGQKLSTENSLYAPVAENGKTAYENLIRQMKALKAALLNGQFFQSGSGVELAGPLLVLVALTVAMAFFIWRFIVLLPQLAPSLAKRLGVGKPAEAIQHRVFARTMKLLERIGLRRGVAETPSEFTTAAARTLQPSSGAEAASVGSALSTLTEHYYAQRFGPQRSQSSSELERVQGALDIVEQAVTQEAGNGRKREQRRESSR